MGSADLTHATAHSDPGGVSASGRDPIYGWSLLPDRPEPPHHGIHGIPRQDEEARPDPASAPGEAPPTPTANSPSPSCTANTTGRCSPSRPAQTGGDRQWAEDVVQETMIRAWRSMDQLDPEAGSAAALAGHGRAPHRDRRPAAQGRAAARGRRGALESLPTADGMETLLHAIVVTEALKELTPGAPRGAQRDDPERPYGQRGGRGRWASPSARSSRASTTPCARCASYWRRRG